MPKMCLKIRGGEINRLPTIKLKTIGMLIVIIGLLDFKHWINKNPRSQIATKKQFGIIFVTGIYYISTS